ncbi:MAG: tetratricopeptide repeat protein [Betaproteobacteria bacterium]|nr:tetratricopeptide repeat protein [Betaproteobacteria bacterium]
MLARGYLGDTYNKIGRSNEALAVFQGYLEILPSNPWVLSRIGYTYSRLGDHKQALEWTNKSLRLTPSDSEILLEMSGRMVDAGRNEDALAILKGIVADGSARGGSPAHWLYPRSPRPIRRRRAVSGQGDRDLHRARRVEDAGRARYDLAKLWMRLGAPDNALRQLQFAIDEGYRDTDKFSVDPGMKPLLENPRYQAMVQRPLSGGPEYIAPFPVNPENGDVALAESPTRVPVIPF